MTTLKPWSTLDLMFHRACATPSDINENLEVLRHYCEECGADADLVEFGVRGVVSTWAMLAARPANLLSVDIAPAPESELAVARAAASNESIGFEFKRCDTLVLPPVKCDLLFIDTLHTYKQLSAELERHAAGVRKFMVFHDVETFGMRGEDGTEPGLVEAIGELLSGGMWRVEAWRTNNNGLAVLRRTSWE